MYLAFGLLNKEIELKLDCLPFAALPDVLYQNIKFLSIFFAGVSVFFVVDNRSFESGNSDLDF